VPSPENQAAGPSSRRARPGDSSRRVVRLVVGAEAVTRRRPPGADLGSQVEGLRKGGSHVEVITPDAESRAAMGTNQMDPATRNPAARAGFAQGKQEATRVKFL